MSAIYMFKDGNTATRLDSRCVEPMLKAGYTIIKTDFDAGTSIQIGPDDEMPEDFVVKSFYGAGAIIYDEPKEGE